MKTVAIISDDALNLLASVPEFGMGYYMSTGRLEPHGRALDCAIVGDKFVIPLQVNERFFSVEDLLAGTPFPIDDILPNQSLSFALSSALVHGAYTAPVVRNVSAVPRRAGKFVGAVSLLGSVKHTTAVRCYRYTRTAKDYRYSGSHLAYDTYLTTENDQRYANTGYAAVGRYALPCPVPAAFVHVYDIAPTTLFVGTVAPAYGQSGGGVELRTQSAPPASSTIASGFAATHVRTRPLDEY